MFRKAVACAALLLLVSCPVTGADSSSTEAAARWGFEQILDLWRAENYEELYTRLEHPPDKGWDYFAQRIVYASRLPACCWQKLQDVKTSLVGDDTVIVSARVGFEVEGIGTRYVVRDFTLQRRDGVWMLPMEVILDLANYNLQRIPRKIYERTLD